MKKSQITAKSERKKTIPKSAWKPGQSGNPGGRPKAQKSITYWLDEFGNQTPASLANDLLDYAKQLRQLKGELPIFGHVAIRTLMAIINEPDARLLAQVLDRTEGKVPDKLMVSDWRQDAQAAGLDPDALVNDLFRKVTSEHD